MRAMRRCRGTVRRQRGEGPRRGGRADCQRAGEHRAMPSGFSRPAPPGTIAPRSSPNARSTPRPSPARCARARSTGRHRPRRLRPDRRRRQGTSGRPDAQSAMRHRLFRRTAPDRGHRPAARERSSSASGGFLESTGRALLVCPDDLRSMIMATIEVRKVEEQLNDRLLFSVRVSADEGHIEFPVGVEDQGSPVANETAALNFHACLGGSARGGDPTKVGSSNASLGVKISGQMWIASLGPSWFEPRRSGARPEPWRVRQTYPRGTQLPNPIAQSEAPRPARMSSFRVCRLLNVSPTGLNRRTRAAQVQSL